MLSGLRSNKRLGKQLILIDNGSLLLDREVAQTTCVGRFILRHIEALDSISRKSGSMESAENIDRLVL